MTISFDMTHRGSIYLVLGLLAGCLGGTFTLVLSAQTIAPDNAGGSAHHASASNVAGDKPLITITGLCDNPPEGGTANSKCETVITQAEFEKIINAIQPRMSARARHEFALRYADGLILAKEAESLGLDRGTNYEEQMKVARIDVLSQDLKRVLQENASHISEEDIETYYRQNAARFELANVDRLYVPNNQRPTQSVREEADQLHARAIAGEDFAKLQADAYQLAGMTTAAPNTSLEIRRISLPPSQVSVMDLNPGAVSPVFADANGLFIYKMKSKAVRSLDQSREEIKANLRTERMENEMRRIHGAATSTINESYFSR